MALWVGAALPASALLLDPLSIESLTREAEIVVQGKVLSKSCQRDSSGRIYTRVELHVSEVWKGALSGHPLVVVHGGGTLGEEESVVAGQAAYELGEDVVAFLVRNARGEAVTLGLAQGKFNVWMDAVTRTQYVVNPFHGVPAASSSRLGLTSRSDRSPPGSLKLSELKSKVTEGAR